MGKVSDEEVGSAVDEEEMHHEVHVEELSKVVDRDKDIQCEVYFEELRQVDILHKVYVEELSQVVNEDEDIHHEVHVEEDYSTLVDVVDQDNANVKVLENGNGPQKVVDIGKQGIGNRKSHFFNNVNSEQIRVICEGE